MAVMVIAEVTGASPATYDPMIAQLGETLRGAKGFIAHFADAGGETGWRVIELWSTKEEAVEWFAKYVAPNLPPGVKPKRTYHQLHSLVMK